MDEVWQLLHSPAYWLGAVIGQLLVWGGWWLWKGRNKS